MSDTLPDQPTPLVNPQTVPNTNSSVVENTSGTDTNAPLPLGVAGWGWGPFFLTVWWGIFNNVWISLITFIPLIGSIMPVVLGIKGRELAWKAKRWKDVDDFNRVQRIWSVTGLAFFIVGIIINIVLAIIFLPMAFNFYFGYTTNINAASKAYSNKQYDLQLEKATLSLEFARNNQTKSVSYYWKGLAEYKLGDIESAEKDEKLALSLNPYSSGPYVTLSAIEGDKGNHQQALNLGKKCVEIDPNWGWCHNAVGVSLIQLGSKEEGIQELEKAVSLDPNNPVFAENLTLAKSN